MTKTLLVFTFLCLSALCFGFQGSGGPTSFDFSLSKDDLNELGKELILLKDNSILKNEAPSALKLASRFFQRVKNFITNSKNFLSHDIVQEIATLFGMNVVTFMSQYARMQTFWEEIRYSEKFFGEVFEIKKRHIERGLDQLPRLIEKFAEDIEIEFYNENQIRIFWEIKKAQRADLKEKIREIKSDIDNLASKVNDREKSLIDQSKRASEDTNSQLKFATTTGAIAGFAFFAINPYLAVPFGVAAAANLYSAAISSYQVERADGIIKSIKGQKYEQINRLYKKLEEQEEAFNSAIDKLEKKVMDEIRRNRNYV